MDYNKKYFIVSSEEEDKRLQKVLIDAGWRWDNCYSDGFNHGPVNSYGYPCSIQVGAEGNKLLTYSSVWWIEENTEKFGLTKAELPWLSEGESVKDVSVGDYSNKYFRVNSEAESRKLQEFLFGLGYEWRSGSSEYYEVPEKYPYFIATDCADISTIGWGGMGDVCFYQDKGNEYAELPPGVADVPQEEPVTNEAHIWTDKHYNFIVDVSKQDTIKIDPYQVAKVWKLGSKDESGVLFHLLKTIARYGTKNPVEREIKALYKQVKRLAELENVNLED